MVGTIRAPLFVPANRPERFGKAAASGTDAVILDLEDAVAVDAKDAARAALTKDFTALPVIVRINAQGTPWYDADMAAVAALHPAAVILPKAEDAGLAASAAATLGVPVIKEQRGIRQLQLSSRGVFAIDCLLSMPLLNGHGS